MICPICNCKISEDLIIDLVQCSYCSHIFKKEIKTTIDKYSTAQLHMFGLNILKEIRDIVLNMGEGEEMAFEFPSMLFYTMEIKPNDFYNDKFNHYFNQMSLIILLERCGLIPVNQINEWEGNVCLTRLTVKKEVIK